MTDSSFIHASELADISVLWTDRCGRYVLIHLRGSPPDALMPYDRVEQRMMLIDGPGLQPAVTRKMLEGGMPVEEADVTMDPW
jgi:hypothetical protein